MNFDLIKNGCRLFASNFPGNIKIYLFGDLAQKGSVHEINAAIKKSLTYRHPPNIDLLFEVDLEVFKEYQQECQSNSINFFSGQPINPTDHYWDSNEKLFLIIVEKILRLDILTRASILIAFVNLGKISIRILPFDWRQNEKLLQNITTQNKAVVESLKNTLLVFEKAPMKNHCACGNGKNCCKISGSIHHYECACSS